MAPSNEYYDGDDDDHHRDDLSDIGDDLVDISKNGINDDDDDDDDAVDEDDDDDSAVVGRYETSYSKLAAASRNGTIGRRADVHSGGGGGATRRGYGGGGAASAIRADGDGTNRQATDTTDVIDGNNRLVDFDRLPDLDDADLFAMEKNEEEDDEVAEDIFLDNDIDDVEEDDDVGVAEEDDDDNDMARDRMEKEEGEEVFSSRSNASDDDDDEVEKHGKVGNNIVGGEFEAFRESAATGRRRRQKHHHHQSRLDETPPSTPNADLVATTTDKNSIHSPKNSKYQESNSVVNETNVNENIPPPPPPTKTQLLQLVDNLFSNISNTDAMTVGGINRSVASHYGWEKVDKPRRSIIKERLTLLIMGTVKPGGGKIGTKKPKNEAKTKEEDEDNDDEFRKKKKRSDKKKEKMMQRKERKKSIKASKKYSKTRDEADKDGNIGHDDNATDGTTNDESENSDIDSSGDVGNDSSSDYEEHAASEKKNTRRRHVRRSSILKSSSGKMAKHLRDQHTKARRRQMEEARIRREELGHLADYDNEKELDNDEEDATKEGTTKKKKKKEILCGDDTKDKAEDDSKNHKLSEEDRQRAQAIAARFDTNRDELRVKRIEDRVELIDRLRTKRLELISSSLSEDEEDEMIIADLAGKLQKDVDVVDYPKLTSTNVVPNATDTKNKAGDDDDEKSSSSSSNENDNDEEESEDDLEIVAQQPSSSSGSSSNLTMNTTIQKRTSTVDLLFQQLGNQSSTRKDPQKVSKPPANPRMALQKALRAKVLSSGNRWLARELGYKDEEDHIRDCKKVEDKKRKQVLLEEKEAALRDRERETAFLRSQMLEEDDNGFFGEIAREDAMKMLGASDLPAAKYDEEEDEEMAMARELEQLEDGADGDEVYDEDNDEYSNVGESFQEFVDDESKSPIETMSDDDNENDQNTFLTAELEEGISTSSRLPIESMVMTPSQDNLDEETSVKRTGAGDFDMYGIPSDFAKDTDDSLEVNDAPNVSRSSRENSHMGEEHGSPETDQHLHDHVVATNPSNDIISEEKATSKKPRNSAWQAILLKEKTALAKEKRRQQKNGGLVEAEAEEEEEEEGIVGLEDFGFAVSKKKDDDDDDDGDVDQDDLDHVVDDVSDGEGDEEAGEVARKRLEQAEEKERHKEIIRRMREGYDGRRGGIASGVGGARGTLRFDQLVAADNRDDAKRLGLLNDDELNSDDEQDENKDKTKDDEEEDEAALLDKMLKERFLNRDDAIYADENFTDDEESDDDADGTDQNNANEDDDDNREQDRLAKYFEKRARRNRILEEFEGDAHFSRSRLIDEDVSMQQDLKTMKTLFCRKRGVEGSNLDFKENNGLSKKQKNLDSRDDDASKSTPGLFLSVLASRRGAAGRKRTTTFVSGKKEMKTSFSRSHSSSLGKSVALSSHVVFVAGDSSQSSSQLPDTTGSRVSFLGAVKSRGHIMDSKVARSGSSLWTKVCSKNFR